VAPVRGWRGAWLRCAGPAGTFGAEGEHLLVRVARLCYQRFMEPPQAARTGARTAFASGYTTTDVGRLLGLSPVQIRAWVRAGCVEPRRGPRSEYRFSFQDLVVLRTARELMAHVPARRVTRALKRLRRQLPRGRGLAGVRLTAEGDDIVVREGGKAWEPESGQALAADVAPLARQSARDAQQVEQDLQAEDWYDLACEMEAIDPAQARDAYRRALELDPEHFDARVNLGRLLHEAGELAAAEANYRLALRLRPEDATAAFNLGVALEDLRRPAEALRAYERAIASDPHYADAHYNLAHLYEALGRPRNALRHLQAYRSLVQGA
jgi:tetratricopeptide (TPR) repeat protein